MSSSRLPGKVLMKAANIPFLEHLIIRLKSIGCINEIVLATTTKEIDLELVNLAKKLNINFFQGSEDDVMGRVLGAAKHMNADCLVEITGDCPLIDPSIVEHTIGTFLVNRADYVANNHIKSYPDGMDVQVMSRDILEDSYSRVSTSLEKEHVTLHIRRNPELYNHIYLIAPKELRYPELGLTLDEHEDFLLLKKITETLFPVNPTFNLKNIINLLDSNPNWKKINSHISRKGDS